VVYEGRDDLVTMVCPHLDYDTFEAEVDYINTRLGTKLDVNEVKAAAIRMGHTIKETSDAVVKVQVSPIRADILHACDVAEEIGIGYGFNKIPFVYPPTNTVGSFIPENRFTDLLRHEMAQAGYIESLTCALISIKENYTNLRYQPNLDEAVQLSNPKTLEYEVVRTSLIPGLLKTLHSNQNERIPQKIFEISDTARIDTTSDTNARNHRKICIMQLNTSASFEVIHGALDLLMTKVGAAHGKHYCLREHANPEQDRKYFPKRAADVLLEGKAIGTIGVLHPEVIENF
jgi:phenylalanyl-tRNA synthetase beta chain